MNDGRLSSEERLDLQLRGMDLAVGEAKERQAEIERLLSSRRMRLAAREDVGVREARLSLLEELAMEPYPSLTLLAAARQLAVACSPKLSVRRRSSIVVGAVVVNSMGITWSLVEHIYGHNYPEPYLLTGASLVAALAIAAKRRALPHSMRRSSLTQREEALAIVNVSVGQKPL